MATYYPAITDEQAALIKSAPMFFVATADPQLAKGPHGVGAVNLSPKGDSLFTKSAVWVRIIARVSNPSGVLIQGKAVLTKLDLRVVIQDKLF